ncbi:MAG: prephenate dehydratase [Syntrophales bacterium]|jgi:chorismate mutase/prephenate dehydratase|nr:prephenate dehydratase [Syntrophales bacterium]
MTDKKLLEIRRQMSEADQKIIRLLEQRAGLARKIGSIKEEHGTEIYDPAREAQIMSDLEKALRDDTLPAGYLKTIYREIISACRNLQRPMEVACLGPAASFTHLAAKSHFGGSTAFSFQSTISHVFDEMERGRADLGVVPIENTFEGPVNFTVDRLIHTPIKVIGEIYQRINHCLLSEERDLTRIRRVYSHPQAFAQCQDWLKKKMPDSEYLDVSSTSAAAQRALQEKGAAAIASILAASVYGLNVLAESIQDHPFNTTRFIVLGQTTPAPTGTDKTSIIFGTPHSPGALHRALGAFADRQINLMKIESYPLKERLWEYLFFADFGGHEKDPVIEDCLNHLKTMTTFVKVLGSYPRAGENL